MEHANDVELKKYLARKLSNLVIKNEELRISNTKFQNKFNQKSQ